MSKCRYNLSEICNNTDCLNCVLDKIRDEIIEEFSPSVCSEESGCLNQLLKIIDKYRGDKE